MIRKVLLTLCVVSSLAAMKQAQPFALDKDSSARKTEESSDEARGLVWRLARAVAFYIRDGQQFDKELIVSLCREGADQRLVLDGYDWGIARAPYFKGSVLDYVNRFCDDSNEAIQARAVEVRCNFLDLSNDQAAVKNRPVMAERVLPARSRGSSCTPLVSFAVILGSCILLLALQAYK